QSSCCRFDGTLQQLRPVFAANAMFANMRRGAILSAAPRHPAQFVRSGVFRMSRSQVLLHSISEVCVDSYYFSWVTDPRLSTRKHGFPQPQSLFAAATPAPY